MHAVEAGDSVRKNSLMRRRPPDLKTIVVCIVIAMASFAVAIGSLARAGEWRSPATSVTQTPRSVIEGAFASIGTPSLIDKAAVTRPQKRDQCTDFAFWFFNPTCSELHKKLTGRRVHRVATIVIGHPDASAESPTAPMRKVEINPTEVPYRR